VHAFGKPLRFDTLQTNSTPAFRYFLILPHDRSSLTNSALTMSVGKGITRKKHQNYKTGICAHALVLSWQ